MEQLPAKATPYLSGIVPTRPCLPYTPSPLSHGDYENCPSVLPAIPTTNHPVSDLSAVPSGMLGTMGKPKRTFPPDQLAEFKQVVEGSDLTKIGLVEILKKRYVPFFEWIATI